MFRYYVISLKQTNYPVPPRDNVIEFDVQTSTKYLEKNIKLQCLSNDLQDNFKEAVTEYWDVFCEDVFRQPIRIF